TLKSFYSELLRRNAEERLSFLTRSGSLSGGREVDLAHETFSVPVESHLTSRMASYHGLYHVGAEALARRRTDRRTSCLSPAERELPVFGERPLDMHLTLRRG